MTVDYEWLSPTRTIGLLAFSTSLATCVARWVRLRKSHYGNSLFTLLASVQFALLLDMAFDWRWMLHQFWVQAASAKGVYGERRPWQVMALTALSFILVCGSLWILLRLGKRLGAAMAAIGTLLSVGLWCAESLSYHGLDRILYHQIGPVLPVSGLWACLAVFTCCGGWLDSRRYKVR